MTAATVGWGSYELSNKLSLSIRDQEVVIDRTCARCGCEDEWGVHVQFHGDRAGMTSEQLTSLASVFAFDVAERLRAARESEMVVSFTESIRYRPDGKCHDRESERPVER